MKNNEVLKNNQLLYIAIFFYFAYDLVKTIIAYISNRSDWGTIICSTILIILVVFAVFSNIKRIKPILIFIIFTCATAIFITTLLHPEYHDAMFVKYNIWSQIFGIHSVMVLLLLVSLINSPRSFLFSIKIGALMIFVDRSIKTVFGNYLSATNNSNHEFGYMFLFVAIVFFVCLLKDKGFLKLCDILIFALSSFMMVYVGARTTILAYVLFLLMHYFFQNLNKKVFLKKIMIVSIVFCLFALFIFTSLRDVVSSALSSLGISSKIINAIISGENNLDGGRLRIYENAKLLMANNPFGLGVYWDRFYFDGSYAHNIFYEIVIDFGWFVGGFIFLWIAFSSFKILFSKRDEWIELFLVFFSLWIVRLWLSYSFWLDISFWATIGIFISFRNFKNTKKRKGDYYIFKNGVAS